MTNYEKLLKEYEQVIDKEIQNAKHLFEFWFGERERIRMNNGDEVKVVRCKDCKHGKYREDYDDYECEASGCGLVNNADFYCADGERRDNGTD